MMIMLQALSQRFCKGMMKSLLRASEGQSHLSRKQEERITGGRPHSLLSELCSGSLKECCTIMTEFYLDSISGYQGLPVRCLSPSLLLAGCC